MSTRDECHAGRSARTDATPMQREIEQQQMVMGQQLRETRVRRAMPQLTSQTAVLRRQMTRHAVRLQADHVDRTKTWTEGEHSHRWA